MIWARIIAAWKLREPRFFAWRAKVWLRRIKRAVKNFDSSRTRAGAAFTDSRGD